MTMATETENNGPETKEIKDVKEMKEALKDDAPPDNKQEEKDAAKKDEAAGKKDDDAAGGGGAAAATAAGANAAPAKASTVHHPDYEKDVVYLYQFPRTPLLPSLSPYGLKVETWLRLNGIKYEVSGVHVQPRRDDARTSAAFSVSFFLPFSPRGRPWGGREEKRSRRGALGFSFSRARAPARIPIYLPTYLSPLPACIPAAEQRIDFLHLAYLPSERRSFGPYDVAEWTPRDRVSFSRRILSLPESRFRSRLSLGVSGGVARRAWKSPFTGATAADSEYVRRETRIRVLLARWYRCEMERAAALVVTR